MGELKAKCNFLMSMIEGHIIDGERPADVLPMAVADYKLHYHIGSHVRYNAVRILAKVTEDARAALELLNAMESAAKDPPEELSIGHISLIRETILHNIKLAKERLKWAEHGPWLTESEAELWKSK